MERFVPDDFSLTEAGKFLAIPTSPSIRKISNVSDALFDDSYYCGG